jgi:hypothetical protein
MQITFRQVNQQVASVQRSVQALTTANNLLLREKATMTTQVTHAGARLTQTAASLDTRLAKFRALVPALKDALSDYTHCGWVGKSYKALVQVAICQSTERGLDALGIYMLAGALLFFLSFFVHMHGV